MYWVSGRLLVIALDSLPMNTEGNQLPQQPMWYCHGNICLKSVFADAALEWKLAGLEYSHAFADTAPTKSTHSAEYDPPEVVKGGPHKAHKW